MNDLSIGLRINCDPLPAHTLIIPRSLSPIKTQTHLSRASPAGGARSTGATSPSPNPPGACSSA